MRTGRNTLADTEKVDKKKLLHFRNSLMPYLMEAWGVDNYELSILLEKYNLVPYIDASYELYQTMGVDGIIEDLEEFISEQCGEI